MTCGGVKVIVAVAVDGAEWVEMRAVVAMLQPLMGFAVGMLVSAVDMKFLLLPISYQSIE